jgi:hypothetical protein
MLRKKIREEGESYLDKNKKFDLENIEFISAPEYPVLNKDLIDEYYNIYQKDPKNEFLLAKHLHENIKIDRNLAANNLYWVYLNLNHFYDYIKDRWLNSRDGVELGEKDIDRYFLSLEPSQNSLIKSPIAGLWWAIELTIDENLEDKYYYSRLFLSDRNLRNKTLGTYQLIRYKHVLHALLDFFATYKDTTFEGVRIGSEAIASQMTKTLNQIGGLFLLGYLSKQQVFGILFNNKDIILRRAFNVKKGKVRSREKQKELSKDETTVDESNANRIYIFSLLDSTREYKILTKKDHSFDHNIPMDISNEKSFIVHFYKEGKIKKSNLDELKHRIKRGKCGDEYLFKNGMNEKLNLKTITSINENALFAVAYKSSNGTFVKLLDAQDETHFRSNNSNLRQEGKKVIYSKPVRDSIFKPIPHTYHIELNKLIKTPIARGVKFRNPYYKKEWNILKRIWPELFNF